jgi:hypothetical protein
MTAITRTIVRESLATIGSGANERRLIVELHPAYLLVRVKGVPRSAVAVDYRAIWDLGIKLEARNAEALSARKVGRRV